MAVCKSVSPLNRTIVKIKMVTMSSIVDNGDVFVDNSDVFVDKGEVWETF